MAHPQAARTHPISTGVDDASRSMPGTSAGGRGSSACPGQRRQARSRRPEPFAGGKARGEGLAGSTVFGERVASGL